MRQIKFFKEEERLERLSKMGDPLEKIARAIDFEIFRPILNEAFPKKASAQGGRPPCDCVLMFKILLLQQWNGIADDKTEYMINDRMSFQRFLGLTLEDRVPDAKTIWLYRDVLNKSGRAKELFLLFEKQLEKRGVVTKKGTLVDATFVDAPKQRNSREENEKIKSGEGSELWSEDANKSRQKDKDARWAKKGNETHYGYKDHVKVDKDSKIIVDFSVTDASVHDSREVEKLIDETDDEVYMDSAYAGEEISKQLEAKSPNIKLKVIEKGYRNKPLTEEQKASNQEKSKVRVRVEHVFGHMTNSFGGIFVRCIGIGRATCQITLKNLAYNMQRYAFLSHIEKRVVPCQG